MVEKYNAPINRSDRWGGSPLDDAHRHRHSEVVAYLRSHGASTGSTDQTTNLITAAVTGDIDEIKMLLNEEQETNGGDRKTRRNSNQSPSKQKKIDLDKGDYDSRTALHLAAAAGHQEIVSFLISKGASVNIIDNWGGTPLVSFLNMYKLAKIMIFFVYIMSFN